MKRGVEAAIGMQGVKASGHGQDRPRRRCCAVVDWFLFRPKAYSRPTFLLVGRPRLLLCRTRQNGFQFVQPAP